MKQFKITAAPRRRTMPDEMRLKMTRSRVALAAFAAFALVVASCSDDDNNDQASAEFTGDDCIYSGPTQFEVGDEYEITVSDVTEERTDVGFAVWPVGGDEVDDDGEFLLSEVTEEGTVRVLTATLDVAGTWQVECFFFNPDGAFQATTFEVVEKP